MAANSTINGDLITESYYNSSASKVSSSTGITVIGRTKTYQTYQDLLNDKQPGKFAYVIDASGDQSVESGFAYYTYENGIWKKLFEEESMDLSVGHTHVNMEVLNMFSMKDRRPTFGSDYLVRQTELDNAIAKAIAWITNPGEIQPDEAPFITRSEFNKFANKLKYEFISTEHSSIMLEDKTYIVRGVKLTAQLPNGDTISDDFAVRLIVDDGENIVGPRGVVVCDNADTINNDDQGMFIFSGAVDVTIVYDRSNRDWVVFGTVN